MKAEKAQAGCSCPEVGRRGQAASDSGQRLGAVDTTDLSTRHRGSVSLERHGGQNVFSFFLGGYMLLAAFYMLMFFLAFFFGFLLPLFLPQSQGHE